MKEKVILSLSDIKKELREVKNKREYIKQFLQDKDYEEIKKNLQEELRDVIIKSPIKPTFNLTYDSLNEGLEPIYFWILDTMNDSPPGGIGLNVWKGPEDFEASVSSGYFGEIGQRATLMQQKAMEYLGTINNIIKSILNLVYDLKEFEIKIEPYNTIKDEKASEEKKSAAMYSLKGIWMDQVDARKGRGSVNMLAQDLQFITLRDAFFAINNIDDIDKKDIDLNDRVKRILKMKLSDFFAWKKYSEEEIKKRYEIERAYLKSQVGTLRLYAHWLRPYLIAAQKLKMRNATGKNLTNPNIVNAFSNMEIEIKLYGKKEISPGAVHESFRGISLDIKYYALTEIIMKFRSVPSSLAGQGGRQYIHGGRVDITFNAYNLDNTELEAIEARELYEDLELIDEYIGTSLKKLDEEIQKYTKEPEKEKPAQKPQSNIENPFKGLFSGFTEFYKPISEMLIKEKKQNKGVIYEELESLSKKQAQSQTYLIYNLYKKTHGMAST